MTPLSEPDLSAIVVTPDSFASIRKAVRHLHAQNIRDRVELVIVAPAVENLGVVAEEVEGFWGCRVIELGQYENGGSFVAAGVRAARAPIVVYVEEHSYPAPGWAEALVAAFRGPWAAVGPAVRNANPARATSWAALFLDFGSWVAPGRPGECRLLASHQTAYRRAILLGLGDELDELLECETTLQNRLLAQGHRLYFEPAAQTDHVNVSRADHLIQMEYHNYRAFAANRAAHGGWSTARRMLYIAGSPLIPFVRGYRTYREVRRTGRFRELAAPMAPAVIIGLTAGAIGEVMGYVFGPGDSPKSRITFELERLQHVTEQDRREVAAG